MRTTLQASPAAPAPMYFHPLLPAGLPRPFHVPLVSEYAFTAFGPPEPMLSNSDRYPLVTGLDGRLNDVVALETNLPRMPVFTRPRFPGMSSSGSLTAS